MLLHNQIILSVTFYLHSICGLCTYSWGTIFAWGININERKIYKISGRNDNVVSSEEGQSSCTQFFLYISLTLPLYCIIYFSTCLYFWFPITLTYDYISLISSSHLHIILNKYFPVFFKKSTKPIQFIMLLYSRYSGMPSHLLQKNFFLHFLIFKNFLPEFWPQISCFRFAIQ